MFKLSYKKYKPYGCVNIKNRQWPNKLIEKAPTWCSVDLRDGNQSLPVPMNVDEKLNYSNYFWISALKK